MYPLESVESEEVLSHDFAYDVSFGVDSEKSTK